MSLRRLLFALALLSAAALVPFALIARARASTSVRPRFNLVFDMAKQPKLTTQTAHALFADTRAMRPPVTGTVARGELDEDSARATGRGADGEWVTGFPLAVSDRLVRRGQERYDVYCAPCHGLTGYGDGPVARRAEALLEGTWTPPSSYHADLVRGRPVGYLFNLVTNGVRNMAAYGPQLAVDDRWAVVLYLRALQRSQDARLDDVPPERRGQLR